MADRFSEHSYEREFTADEPNLPEQFLIYKLDKNRIGSGPLSFIYKAIDTDRNLPVRLKVFRKRICQLADIRSLLERHAQIRQIYRGDQLLEFHCLRAFDQIIFYEEEFVDAISLAEMIEESAPFHPDLAVLIVQQIIAGLNQIHGAKPSPGMGNLIPLHRNLKAANVLIAKTGQIKLCDPDLYQLAEFCEKQRLQLPYSQRCYLSPEQLLRDGYADRRSDIYSLGLIMLQMVTGKLPYIGNNQFETRQNIRENSKEKISSFYPKYKEKLRRQLLGKLATLIKPMIEHNPDRRCSSLMEVEDVISRYLEGSDYLAPQALISNFVVYRNFTPARIGRTGFWSKILGK